MSLLTITDPSKSEKKLKNVAIGIDLGTTHSLVSIIENNKPVALVDSHNNALLPSIVQYLDQKIEVGALAKKALLTDPLNTIASIKRLMGRGSEDVNIKEWPYHFSNDEKLPKIKTKQGLISAVEISAEILKALKLRAEQYVKQSIHDAVITVPAYFDDAQRQATKDAAALAGLNVLRLLNEPTAAAIAYGLDQANPSGVHLIYDLGGGTFDVSVLRLHKGLFEVLATGGDTHLGGDDVDRLIADWVISQAGITGDLSPEKQQTLMAVSRAAKEALSTALSYELVFESKHLELTRETFEQLIRPLIQKTIDICCETLSSGDLTANDLDAIVFVGGSTRIPFIQTCVEKSFGQKPLCDLDPDKVVAYGAAIQAGVLTGKSLHDVVLLDVLPLSVGLETMGGLVEKVIERNTTLPVFKQQQFTTFKDGQTGLLLHVVQGEREMVSDCRSLARFELKGIPPMPAGLARIEVTFQVDVDGVLTVSAKELSTGIQSDIQIKPTYGLTEAEMADMLMNSAVHAKEDFQARAIGEKRIEAEQLYVALHRSLHEDGKALLDEAQHIVLTDELNQLKNSIDQKDIHMIEEQIEHTNKAFHDFIEQRLQYRLTQSLSGRSIEEWS